MAFSSADVFKTVQPLEYYRSFLKNNKRPDGRELFQSRQTFLNIGYITSANGSAMVKQGETTVVCGVKGELVTPSPEEPKKGFIVPNVDLPPLCASFFKPGPPSEQAQVLSQQIQELIENSNLKTLLHFIYFQLVWCLYIDIICLNYDGSVIDACVIALLSALLNTTLPVVQISEETNRTIVEHNTESLKVHHLPISLSFTIFDGETVIADPTKEEEFWSSGTFHIVILEDGSLAGIHKPGGSAITDEDLCKCITLTKNRSAQLIKLINKTILTLKT
ncbi:exosome complex component RRP43-like [Centruroides sculpturatus]|uniref:exosome complex component RRP43-like n=1 Tax=Centruroides sculpturatus TaxID=218467 RepID=UPI000C6D9928|nr:exosome complex component RRP43-like [Centruroides sculpturatus]